MKIKYFGNMRNDNGHIVDNTRIAVIDYKDSEEEKFTDVYNALTNAGYKFTFATDNGDGLNEAWFSVEDKDDFADLKDIYMKVKRGSHIQEQFENVSEQETPETTTVSEVKECEYCRECIYYEKCTSNAPERMQCKSKNGGLGCGCPVCCANFVSRKSIDDIYEEQKAEQSEDASQCCSSFCIMCAKLFQCDKKDKSEFSDCKPCPDFQELPF